MSEKQYSVAICRFPGNGWERHELSTWLAQTCVKMKADKRISKFDTLVFAGETPITIARNRAVKVCLDKGFDYILMLDSDMVPDLPGEKPFWDGAWKWMLERRDVESCQQGMYEEFKEDIDVSPAEAAAADSPPATIAAPYCGPPPHENIYVFKWVNFQSDCPDDHFKLEQFTRDEATFRTGIEEVSALPTGIILYDSRVFRVLPAPWFDYEYDADMTEKLTTEDVFQTRNASMLGLPQHVYWDSWAGHAKGKTVRRPQYVTRDQVRDSYRRAVERGIDSGYKIQIMGTPSRVADAPALDVEPDTTPDHAAIATRPSGVS